MTIPGSVHRPHGVGFLSQWLEGGRNVLQSAIEVSEYSGGCWATGDFQRPDPR